MVEHFELTDDPSAEAKWQGKQPLAESSQNSSKRTIENEKIPT
jgi:hypothetical protein